MLTLGDDRGDFISTQRCFNVLVLTILNKYSTFPFCSNPNKSADKVTNVKRIHLQKMRVI